MEDFKSVLCPYCGQAFDIELDVTAGQDQVFVVDCETCCRPVQCHVAFDESGECICEIREDI